MIVTMKKDPEKISEQAKRLYRAAKELRKVEGKSAVADLLNVSPQLVNHWENGRPISSEALLTAQERIGCDAVWLRDGDTAADMVRGSAPRVSDLSDVVQLISIYGQLPECDRQVVLDFARDTASIRSEQGVRLLPYNKS